MTPESQETTRAEALRAISPLRPATGKEVVEHPGILYARRISTAATLPPYFLVYFLLAELLEFPSSGKEEKVAWTIPIVLDGTLLAVQHRKLGLGIFGVNPSEEIETADRAVRLILKSTKAGRPYFDDKARVAVETSRLNVINRNRELNQRFIYFREKYRSILREAHERRDEYTKETKELRKGQTVTSCYVPSLDLAREAAHHGMAAIDAFYSWTEHLFVHLAILSGKCRTGVDVARLAGAEWSAKYKIALSLEDPQSKRFFDELISLRRQSRNFTAHGSFGKNGEAFRFHSAAGAVPVSLGAEHGSPTYSLAGDSMFTEGGALELIDAFVEHLWNEHRRPARMYLIDSDLPVILTLVENHTYERAMRSEREMQRVIQTLHYQFGRAADMDW